MAVSYNKLWKKLIDLGMNKSELRVKAGISTRQLAKEGCARQGKSDAEDKSDLWTELIASCKLYRTYPAKYRLCVRVAISV